MTCPSPANFDTCDPKCRCPNGLCSGIAFDCNQPCPPGAKFDPATCSCESGGTWKVTAVRSGQVNPSNNGTRCYVTYFPPAYFDANGDYITREWFYSQQPWPTYPGADSAFTLIDPNGPIAGFPVEPGGEPGLSIRLGGGGMTSTCVLQSDYCSNPGITGAGHTNGIVSWRNLINNSYVSGNGTVPGGAVNFASCEGGRTGIVKVTLQYLGPGEPTDYYESVELSGDRSSKYRGILNGETGQASCQDPTKSP